MRLVWGREAAKPYTLAPPPRHIPPCAGVGPALLLGSMLGSRLPQRGHQLLAAAAPASIPVCHPGEVGPLEDGEADALGLAPAVGGWGEGSAGTGGSGEAERTVARRACEGLAGAAAAAAAVPPPPARAGCVLCVAQHSPARAGWCSVMQHAAALQPPCSQGPTGGATGPQLSPLPWASSSSGSTRGRGRQQRV